MADFASRYHGSIHAFHMLSPQPLESASQGTTPDMVQKGRVRMATGDEAYAGPGRGGNLQHMKILGED